MSKPEASSRVAKPLRIAMARLNATSCTAIITLLRVWIRSRRMRKFVSTSTPTDFYSFLFRESEASRTLTRMAGTHDRRQFLQALATLASTAAIPGADLASAASSASALRWPKLTGSPALVRFRRPIRLYETGYGQWDSNSRWQISRPGNSSATRTHIRWQHRNAHAGRKDASLATGRLGAGTEIRRPFPQFREILPSSPVRQRRWTHRSHGERIFAVQRRQSLRW